MQRYGSVVGLKPSKLRQYVKLHAAVWPDVLKTIKRCHIRNYSIYLRKIGGKHYLFSYFEYTGKDFEDDMARMATDPVTQQWWSVCKPCHLPLRDRKRGEWWAAMTEVFHLD
jgi:L-rhamnose mutarotase